MVINVPAENSSNKYLVELNNFWSFLKKVKHIAGFVGILFLSPVLILLLKIKSNKLLKAARGFRKELVFSLENNNIDFKSLQHIEKIATESMDVISPLAFIKQSGPTLFIKNTLNNIYLSYKEFEEIKRLTEGAYYFKKSDLGLSDSEFAKYKQQLEDFDDLWSDNPTDEEKELVFNIKHPAAK